jgi:transcriptional regulator with XRE-family HTH domain
MKPMNRLKIILAEKGKTNRWLASTIKKDECTISKWCTNSSQPSIEVLYIIAEALNADVRELLVSNKTV